VGGIFGGLRATANQRVGACTLGKEMSMTDNSYVKARTAFLFVDPYNDFLSDGGKLWP
jgi:hypothetical protein